MLKSEMQHQFWVTKKAVQRKLGTKEDECIVLSDAELDAKIELFKSISESCNRLYRIIDRYQESLCILAQEENALGKFLKETGKNSNTTGKIMINAGKAVSYCGQQRMTIRPSLLRLFHEVEVFRGRAIVDTHSTIIAMEKERTEYRAALSWMKSASSQLDPDTGRGLEKFRKSQTHVRLAKTKFDRLSLDCLQKIDLLAAARCNMFSHALVAYMSTLLQYAIKTTETFKATIQALSTSPQYNFSILKDLTQISSTDGNQGVCDMKIQEIVPIDSDQMLFFMDDYKDAMEDQGKDIQEVDSSFIANTKQTFSETEKIMNDLIDIKIDEIKDEGNEGLVQSTTEIDLLSKTIDDLISMKEENSKPSFMPSQLLLQNDSMAVLNDFSIRGEVNPPENEDETKGKPKEKNSLLDFFNIAQTNKNLPSSKGGNEASNQQQCSKKRENTIKQKDATNRKDISAWYQLFSELDPLANPDAMAKTIEGKSNNEAA